MAKDLVSFAILISMYLNKKSAILMGQSFAAAS